MDLLEIRLESVKWNELYRDRAQRLLYQLIKVSGFTATQSVL